MLKSPHLFVLVSFVCPKISIALQKMQASSILCSLVIIGLVISRLPPLQDTPPITTTNLLQVIDLTSSKFSLFPFSYSFLHFLNLRCVYK
jgi:hypothetical protein